MSKKPIYTSDTVKIAHQQLGSWIQKRVDQEIDTAFENFEKAKVAKAEYDALMLRLMRKD
jgi:hypothetical protein